MLTFEAQGTLGVAAIVEKLQVRIYAARRTERALTSEELALPADTTSHRHDRCAARW
jgi:hypothetical protein